MRGMQASRAVQGREDVRKMPTSMKKKEQDELAKIEEEGENAGWRLEYRRQYDRAVLLDQNRGRVQEVLKQRFRPPEELVQRAKPKGGGSKPSPDPAVSKDGAGTRRKYATKGLFGCDKGNPIRAACINLVDHPWFDRVVLCVILINCVAMALNEPFAPQSRKKVLEEMDNAFLYCFTVEAVVKILAMGFVIERNSYLRDPWNQLDFTVVCLDWLSFFLQGSYNFSILRSIRILRPLRTINRFPGMRVIVKSLLDSLPLLADAFILFLFIVLFFGIIGLQLYSGAFRQQCFCVTEGLQEADSNHPDLVKEFPSLAPYENTTTGALLPRPKGSNLTTECVEQEDGDFPGLFRPEGEERYCTESEGMGTGHCGDWEVCRPFGENPNDGVTNFDNLGWAVLLVFQVITLEGWASIMNLTRATKGIVNDLFYIGLVVFGAFFMINLVVAVLVSNFDQSSDEEAAGGGEQAGGEAKPGEPSPLGGSTGNAMGDTELQESLLADAVHAAEKTNPMYISRCFGCCRRHKKEGGPEGLREWRCSEGWADFLKCLFGEGGLFARISASAWFERFIMLVITVNTGTLAMDHWGMPVEMENFIELANFICTFIFIAEMVIKMAGLGIGNYWSNSWNKFDAAIVLLSIVEIILFYGVQLTVAGGGGGAFTAFRAFRLIRVFKLAKQWKSLNKLVNTVGSSIGSIGNLGFLMLIFMLIYALLGMDLYGANWPKVEGSNNFERPNFHNFLYSFVTVFILLTGENWNDLLYWAVSRTGWYAAFYFVSVIILGTYILLNVFLAILIRNFSSERHRATDKDTEAVKDGEGEEDGEGESSSEEEDEEAEEENGEGKGQHMSTQGQVSVLAQMPMQRSISGQAPEQPAEMSPVDSGGLSPTQSVMPVDATPKRIPPFWTEGEEGEGEASGRKKAGVAGTHGEPEQGHKEAQPSRAGEEDADDLSFLLQRIDLPSDSAQNSSSATASRLLQHPSKQSASGVSLRQSVSSPQPAEERLPGDSPPGLGPSAHPSPRTSRGREGDKRGGGEGRHPETLSLSPSPGTVGRISSIGSAADPHVPIVGPLASRDPHPAFSARRNGGSRKGNKNGGTQGETGESFETEKDGGVHGQTRGEGVREVEAGRGISIGGDAERPQQQQQQQQRVVKKQVTLMLGDDGDGERKSDGGGSAISLDGALEREMRKSMLEADASTLEQKGSTVKNMKELNGTSCLCLGEDNAFRLACFGIVKHSFFDQTVYGLIGVSAVALAIDSPTLQANDSPELADVRSVLKILDVIFTACFCIEGALKIIVLGFVSKPGKYLRDGWNILDFLVVLVSVLNLCLEYAFGTGVNFGWLKAFRALRALRPLRVVSRNDGMRAVVGSILRAIPAILDVLVVSILFLVIFAIIGVQFLKGRLYRCSDPSVFDQPECVGEFNRTEWVGGVEEVVTESRRWEQIPGLSFDNTASAMLALFEVATLDGWPDLMFLCVDAQEPGKGAKYNANPLLSLFFVCFIFVMTFFVLNLFVGTVIDKFSDIKDEMSGTSFLSPKQLQWVQTQKTLLKTKPLVLLDIPESRWRYILMQFVTTSEFEVTVMTAIILNAATIAMHWWRQPEDVTEFTDMANILFMALFCIEAVLKIFAFKPSFYFRDLWNRFDFVIAFGSLIAFLLRYAGVDLGFDATLLRILRVGRILRLVKSLKQLRNLFETLVSSLPSLVNVGTLLLLLFYVYAVAGMALFGDLSYEGKTELGPNANFRGFYQSMLTLFRMSTGEQWNMIMHDCFDDPACESRENREGDDFTGCGSTPVAIVFFISFMLLGSFMFLNLFIAVIIENFSDIAEDRFQLISEADMEGFRLAWANFCPHGELFLPTHKLHLLLCQLDPPLGFKGEIMDKQQLLHVIANLGLKDHRGRVHFTEVLWSLASCVSGEDLGTFADFEVMRAINKTITRLLPVPKRAPHLRRAYMYSAAQVASVIRIQAAWRGMKLRMFWRETMMLAREEAEKKKEVEDAVAQELANEGDLP